MLRAAASGGGGRTIGDGADAAELGLVRAPALRLAKKASSLRSGSSAVVAAGDVREEAGTSSGRGGSWKLTADRCAVGDASGVAWWDATRTEAMCASSRSMALEGSGMTLEGVGMSAMPVESGPYVSAAPGRPIARENGAAPGRIRFCSKLLCSFRGFRTTVCIILPHAAHAHPPSSR